MISIKLEGITKRFPGIVANDNITLEIAKGEIHAIVGENGAGKSTLMKILCGLYQPDKGQIYLEGKKVNIVSPRRAISLGIGMVHQHFMLIPRFTVLENIILGAEVATVGVLKEKAAYQQVKEMCERYEFALDLNARVENLSVGQQQRVEILKVLYRGAKILILDEPTAVLAPQEVKELFVNLRHLKNEGKTIIFISHKLEEVLEIADRISVLRQGKLMGTVLAKDTDKAKLSEMMVGRPVFLNLVKAPVKPGQERLKVEKLVVLGSSGRVAVKGVSFSIRDGEIYGIAGIEGNGQSELVEALVGLKKPVEGRILISGQAVNNKTVAEIKSLGTGYIPEDRHHRGLILPMSVWENAILGRHRLSIFSSPFSLKFASIRQYADKIIKKFDVRLSSMELPIRNLSGGNQQKVILGRELDWEPQLIIASQPTRGLDIGATEFVHQQLLKAREKGCAVLLVSADLSEVLSLSDRVGVMYNGELVAEFVPGEVSIEEIGHFMLGAKLKSQEEKVRRLADEA
ncbi:nucleoside ABC transporter ATP-binding protein [Thermanaeromonas toyohensis ToBE]|uniref:Nucleoside ABC transporter ATP-binding protein n=1 Tax=Thermanaeromonas toyohensis ToBE TaxID=698762 RepID=A0A1W1VZQ6_9FIRM|nr:ABC transporter ATP-binding protein [Thermanaeromonas toyohensis]SMB98753.1 nucleoside ABC transporter ATP-binding protein [Thermanaeromonas toyohensis ToBE]